MAPANVDHWYSRAIRLSVGVSSRVLGPRIDVWCDDSEEFKKTGYVKAGVTLGKRSITLDAVVAEDCQYHARMSGTESHGVAAKTGKMLDL